MEKKTKSKEVNESDGQFVTMPPEDTLPIVGYVLLFAALVEFVTLFINAIPGPQSPVEFYLRESFMVIGFASVGFFLIQLFYHYMDVYFKKSPDYHWIQSVSLAVSIICLIKGLVAVNSFLFKKSISYIVAIYFASDMMAWFAGGLFILYVCIFVIYRKENLPTVRTLRIVCLLFAAIFILKSAVSLSLFLTFPTPLDFAYYFTDAVAWLSMGIALVSLCRTNLLSTPYVKPQERNHFEDDKSLESALDKIAKGIDEST